MSDNLILTNLKYPEVLEQAYQDSPQEFKRYFEAAYKQNRDSETLNVWYARLNSCSNEQPVASPKNFSILLLLVLCAVVIFLTEIPAFLPINVEWFHTRYSPLIAITAVIAYFLLSTPTNKKMYQGIIIGIVVISTYIALLPSSGNTPSITMALIHLPLLALSLLAYSFMKGNWNNMTARLDFIRFLGEMGTYTALILLGGIVLTAVTLGLFSFIDTYIITWYLNHVVVWGLVLSPLVATYLFDSVQKRNNKFASILSNVFSPLFLITIIVYLFAMLFKGNTPFEDREFLIVFNGLLIIILALTIFSIAGKKGINTVTVSDYINMALISTTLLVNIIALSAILFRWVEYGMTFNRIVVTGANLIIFVHLILLLNQYIRHLKHANKIVTLEFTIAAYLPVYTIWSVIVAFILPVIFSFQ